MTTPADFFSETFLREHIRSIFAFYHPQCIDTEGGFFHVYKTDGERVDKNHRHLVNSTRFVINYARMARLESNETYLENCRHGLNYIERVHKQGGQLFWELQDNQPVLLNDYCYGWAFVLLAYAEVIKSGLDEYRSSLYDCYGAMSEKFWQEEYSLFADEYNGAGQLENYRGQNANMHGVEALLSCYAVTDDQQFLNRAYKIAQRICVELPEVEQKESEQKLVWEHYTQDWQADWQYNIHKPNDMFKPWGFQTGHQTEWSKLLMMLYQCRPESWMLERAEFFFAKAMNFGWDEQYGGLVYGFSPSGEVCDSDKHFWVQAESLAAAAWLFTNTKKDEYLKAYNKIWAYAWDHLVDHRYGAWHHKLTRDGQLISDIKSPLGKNDYHTLGACYDVLQAQALLG